VQSGRLDNLTAESRQVETSLAATVNRLETAMKADCQDACFGAANAMCPKKKRARMKDCI
jgi:hypothetical protein